MSGEVSNNPACVMCGGPARPRWRKQGYTFLQCSACELTFVHPVPTAAEIAKCYETDFFTGNESVGYVDFDREQRWRQMNYRHDVTKMQRFMKPGPARILDVGCATGTFLDVCPAEWDKYGLEVSQYAGEVAKKTYGDHIQITTLDKAVYPENYFDVAVLWETINHMIDPSGDLQRVHRALKPGGIMALSVGDASSFLARVMGKYWYHVTPPIHIYYFTPGTLRNMFDRIGFEMVAVEHAGKRVDLATSFERVRDTTSSPLLTRVCRAFAAMPWGKMVLYINLHDTMQVYARKK